MNLHDVNPRDKFAAGTRVQLSHYGWMDAGGCTGTVIRQAEHFGDTYTHITLDNPNTTYGDRPVRARADEFELLT